MSVRLTSLRIPQLHLPIIRTTQELCPIIIERDILDRLGVTHKRAENVAVVVDIPELAKIRVVRISDLTGDPCIERDGSP